MHADPLSEHDLAPAAAVDRIEALVLDRYPDAVVHRPDEAVFATDGPVDNLAWIAYDGYTEHPFFYHDPDPDGRTLRRYLTWAPEESEMKTLKAFLAGTYEVYEPVEAALVVEIPDPYLPGSDPKAVAAYYHDPHADRLAVGVDTVPPDEEATVLDDIARVVPASDLRTFLTDIVRTLSDELDTAARRILDGDVREYLDASPEFQRRDTQPVPEGIHPEHTGSEAERWEAPADAIDAFEGTDGTVQVWVPVAEERLGLLALTGVDADRETLAAVQAALTDGL